jgi:hypothetical protein
MTSITKIITDTAEGAIEYTLKGNGKPILIIHGGHTSCSETIFKKVWILVTPEDFNKNDMEWFDGMKREFEYIPTMKELAVNFIDGKKGRQQFEIDHWGHAQIISLIKDHPTIGR